MNTEKFVVWEYKKQASKYFIPGDKLYLDINGNVYLNDIKLELGKGLYINKKHHVGICNVVLKHGTIYGEMYMHYYNKKGDATHNVHHKDYNRMNNSLDNLILLSCKKHGEIHRNDKTNPDKISLLNNLHSEYAYHLNKINEYYYTTNSWLIERAKQYYNAQHEYNILLKEQENLLKKYQQEQLNKIKEEIKEEIKQDMLNSGKYILTKNNRLMSLESIEKRRTLLKQWINNGGREVMANSARKTNKILSAKYTREDRSNIGKKGYITRCKNDIKRKQSK